MLDRNTLTCPNCGNVFQSPVQFGSGVTIGSGVSVGASCPRCGHQFSTPLG